EDLGAQFVEIQLFHKVWCQRTRAIEEEAAAILGQCFGDDEIDDDLALRGQQRGKRGLARRDLGRVIGHKPIEKESGGVSEDLHHAAIGKKSCLHAKSLGSLAIVSCQNSPLNVSAVVQASSPFRCIPAWLIATI